MPAFLRNLGQLAMALAYPELVGNIRMATEDISALLGRVALYDRAAFARLYSLTSPKLFAISLRILRDRGDAEEALQEVYVKIWQRAGRYDQEKSAPNTWLAAIARNHAIDVMRARKPVSTSIDEEFDLAGTEMTPEENAIATSDGKRIDRCMEQLESGRADAVRLAYIEGLSYQELAEKFDIPLNTMRTWLRRSLLKLRECLQS